MAKGILRSLGLLVLMGVVAGGCAGMGASTMPLPPAKMLQPEDLASLAGEWRGTLKGTPGVGPLAGRSWFARVTVAPDGSFTSNIDGDPGAGKGRIEGGRVVYEGSRTRGVATLHEGDGRRILSGQGTWVGYDGECTFELTKQ